MKKKTKFIFVTVFCILILLSVVSCTVDQTPPEQSVAGSKASSQESDTGSKGSSDQPDTKSKAGSEQPYSDSKENPDQSYTGNTSFRPSEMEYGKVKEVSGNTLVLETAELRPSDAQSTEQAAETESVEKEPDETLSDEEKEKRMIEEGYGATLKALNFTGKEVSITVPDSSPVISPLHKQLEVSDLQEGYVVAYKTASDTTEATCVYLMAKGGY